MTGSEKICLTGFHIILRYDRKWSFRGHTSDHHCLALRMSNIATDTFNNDKRALFASLASDKATMISLHFYNNTKNITEMNGRAMNTWPCLISTLIFKI